VPYAKDRIALGVEPGAQVGLAEAITMAGATVLLGSSTVHGAFDQSVIEAMAAASDHPLIFPLSNPTSLMEAMPADILAWSKGKALIATGSPIPPVRYGDTTYTIGQANNALVFPGIGLGTIVAAATHVTKGMLDAAAHAVAAQTDPTSTGAAVLPDVAGLRDVSAAVAEAVYRAAVADGVATRTHDDPASAVRATMWTPEYS
jgi:malate dehydrogenase (oxaloacetate-decarboxylating)